MAQPRLAQPVTPQQLTQTAAPGPIAAPVPFWGAVAASAANEFQNNTLGAREEQMRADLWARQKSIRQATGVSLQPSAFMTSGMGDDPVSKWLNGLWHPDDDAYEAQVDKLRSDMPDKMAGVPTLDDVKSDLDARLQATAANAASSAAQHPVAALLGAGAVQLADPRNLALGLVTGGEAEAVPLAQRLLLGGAKQAATWGGAAAAEAPLKAQEARQFGGPAYTTQQALGDIVSGAVGGAALHGVGELLGAAGARLLGRGLPEAIAGDAPAAAPSAGLPAPDIIEGEYQDISDAVRGATQTLNSAGDIGEAVGAQRAGGDFDQATNAVAQAQPPAMPEPTQDPDTLLTEADPNAGAAPADTPTAPAGVQLGDATSYRDRPIYGASFSPDALQTAPDVFQYKGGGDAAGVTDRLRGVQTWDPTSAGRGMVWEGNDGGYYVADGHQRLGLASRLADQNPQLDALLFREADGWSSQDVRTIAALKNIREGSGSPLDAAKVFRDNPTTLNDDSLPITGALAEQGRGLARLSDDAFGSVVNDVVPQHYASLIGNMAGDRPDLHAGMVDLLRQGKPANVDEARALVSESLQADWAKAEGAQDDMFGGAPEQSTVIARAKIKAAVLRQVRGDSRLFSTLTRQADAIEAGGNALARSSNEAALATNRAAEALISKLAYRDGDVGSAMREAAAAVVRGESPASAARRVGELVRRAVQDGADAEQARAVRITPDAPSPASERPLQAFDEPGGPGQTAQLREKPEDVATEGAEQPARPGLFDDIHEPVAARTAHERLAPCAPGGGE